ncbi:MAG: undecaprenyl/decaprenyl-phosphate alpha-N-acetylglucosaminyl 1-phosphate transferase [Verrucomicrobia bacterium]|nr:undecaprenyl/decaprenyl-phosphate alpha-N-acetylglucosaminyl 1-phosphate transferase [Verrucomicrobiota bacterium]
MNLVPIIVSVLLGLAVTWLLIPLICKLSATSSLAARASTFHHTHKTPISRLGGVGLAVAFLVVVLVAALWLPDSGTDLKTRLVIVFGSLAMFLLGLRDDLRPLGARKKLLGQILIASIVCGSGIEIAQFQNPFTHVVYDLGWWGSVFTVLWLVALTNMINLIDGIDGLAAGVALMLMGLLAYVGLGKEVHFTVMCAAGMFGALLGFLRYNFPPAKIYMGDGGAYFLGFLIAILSLVNSHKGTIVAALIAPLFALALPIVDVTLAITRRGLKGLPIFRPDHSHLHHKLVGLGVSRRRAVLILYGLSSVFLLLAFTAFLSEGRLVPILFGFLCLTLLLSAGSFSFSREWFAVGRVLKNSRQLRKESQYALALGHCLEVEAERVRSMEALWAEFAYAARKLGFAGVKLILPDGERVWHVPEVIPESELMLRTHELRTRSPMTLYFSGSKARMSARVFDFLCELAAESWLKAVARWQELHGRETWLGLDGRGSTAVETSAAVGLAASKIGSVPKSA